MNTRLVPAGILSNLTCALIEPGLVGKAVDAAGRALPVALAREAVALAVTGTPKRAARSRALSCSFRGMPKRAALFLRFSYSAFKISASLPARASWT